MFPGVRYEAGHEYRDLARLTESLRAPGFEPADIRLPMNDLPLQVGFIDDIEVDDSQSSDAGCGEIQEHGRSQAAGAYDQNLAVLEAFLSFQTNVGNQQMTAVS